MEIVTQLVFMMIEGFCGRRYFVVSGDVECSSNLNQLQSTLKGNLAYGI